MQALHGLSEQRACRQAGIERSTLRYRSCPRPEEESLRRRLRELAAEGLRFGYWRLHPLLRRAGIMIHHKRVERLYREEGLAV